MSDDKDGSSSNLITHEDIEAVGDVYIEDGEVKYNGETVPLDSVVTQIQQKGRRKAPATCRLTVGGVTIGAAIGGPPGGVGGAILGSSVGYLIDEGYISREETTEGESIEVSGPEDDE